MSSRLVAVCNFAVLVLGSTIRVRNRHPVSPRRSASRKIEMRIGERCILDQESDGPKRLVYPNRQGTTEKQPLLCDRKPHYGRVLVGCARSDDARYCH